MRTITNPNKNLKFTGNKGANQPSPTYKGTELYGNASKITGIIYAHLLEGDVSGLEGDITGITGDVTNIHGKIHPLLVGEVSKGLTGDISGLYGHLPDYKGGLVGDATGIYGNVTGLDGADLDKAWPPASRKSGEKVSIKNLLAPEMEDKYEEEFPASKKRALLKDDGFVEPTLSQNASLFSAQEYIDMMESK